MEVIAEFVQSQIMRLSTTANPLITAQVRLRPKFKNGILLGFAALRAPHPSSPARRGGAKQIEAQRPAAFRAFSVQGLTGAGLPTALYEKKPSAKRRASILFAEREGFTLSSHPVAFWRRKTLQIVEQVISPDLTSHQVFRKTTCFNAIFSFRCIFYG